MCWDSFTGLAYPPGRAGRHYVAAVPLDRDALETFALELVAIPSPSGAEGAVAERVRVELERLGYAVEVDALGNVTGTLGTGDGPCVLFDAHMDTVGVTDPAAWSADPAGERRDGRLYGRGAMDMKGPGVAQLPVPRRVQVLGVASAQVAGRVCRGLGERVEPDDATQPVEGDRGRRRCGTSRTSTQARHRGERTASPASHLGSPVAAADRIAHRGDTFGVGQPGARTAADGDFLSQGGSFIPFAHVKWATTGRSGLAAWLPRSGSR